MNIKAKARLLILILLMPFWIADCQSTQSTVPASTPASVGTLPELTTVTPELSRSFLAGYDFPSSIDPAKNYLFYLHGKIIEDQGLHAVSPDFGEYEYQAILEKLESRGFEVISEQRSQVTVAEEYASRVAEQIKILKDAGIPAENITIVGASKGAGIAVTVSSLVKDPKINFVLLGFCAPDTVRELVRRRMSLYGNVLAIRDSVDNLSGSCQELFDFSEGKGLGRHNEIVLNIGTGHGILYKPLDEWIQPAVDWAKDCACNE
jgi:hypothetical protein